MIKLRTTLSSEIQKFHKRVGTFNFTVETVPSLILVKEKKFNVNKLINRIEETDMPAKFFAEILDEKCYS